MARAKTESETRRQSIWIGGAIAIVGLSIAGYLAVHGNAIVGGIIAAILTTLVAVVVGSQLSR